MRALVMAGCLTAVLLIGGCSTTMTQRASMVRLATPEDVKTFKFLGRVQGSSSLTGVSRQTGYANAKNELLDNAAALGATHVVMIGDKGPVYWTFSQRLEGEAYASPEGSSTTSSLAPASR